MSEHVKVGRRLTWAQNAIETIYGHNKSGQALEPGDVVTLDVTDSTATEVAFNVTTTADDKAVLGMAIENIANNGYGQVQTKGPTALLKCSGTADILVGSYLSTHDAAGIAQVATAGKGGVFAIALEAYATDADLGVIDAYLMGGAGRFDTAASTSTYASPTFTGAITNAGDMTLSSTYDFTIAGTASATDALILTAGDILVTDGHLDVGEADGVTTVVKIDHQTGIMASDNAALYIDDGGNIASGGNMLRLVPTATPNAASILFEIVGAGKIGQAIYVDGDQTGIDLVHFHSGGAITNGFAVLGITNDGNLATGGALLNLTAAGTNDVAARIFEIDGTAEDMLGIYVDVDSATGSMTTLQCGGNTGDNEAVLKVTSDGTMVAGSSLVRIESATATGGATVYGLEIACNATNLEGLYVSLGTSLFAEAVTMGTTAKLYFLDTGLYIYSSTNGQLDIVADTTLALSGAITTDSTITSAASLSGTTAASIASLAVTDTTTCSTGLCKGIAMTWTATGDKTGTAEINGIASDIILTGADVVYCYNFTAYMSASSNPTIAFASAVSIYIDDLGTAVSGLVGIDIGLALPTASAPADRYTYIRCRNHSTGVPDSVILCEALTATYLLELKDTPTFMDTGGTAGTTCVGHIAFLWDDNIRYINVYSDNS